MQVSFAIMFEGPIGKPIERMMGSEQFDAMKAPPTYAEDLLSDNPKVLQRVKSTLDRYKGDSGNPKDWKYDYPKHSSMVHTFLKVFNTTPPLESSWSLIPKPPHPSQLSRNSSSPTKAASRLPHRR